MAQAWDGHLSECGIGLRALDRILEARRDTAMRLKAMLTYKDMAKEFDLGQRSIKMVARYVRSRLPLSLCADL